MHQARAGSRRDGAEYARVEIEVARRHPSVWCSVHLTGRNVVGRATAMADSWEEQADALQESSDGKPATFSFNPKASTFSFNPSASSFAPKPTADDGATTSAAAAPPPAAAAAATPSPPPGMYSRGELT